MTGRKFVAPIDMAGNNITGVASPTAGTDAATKNYVDGLVTGLSWKNPVRAASSTNVNLSSPGATIGGVTMAANDRFLAAGQTAAVENGIYVYNGSAVAATRATDADSAAEILQTSVFVEEGTLADTQWLCTTNAPITLGTTGLTFVQFGSVSLAGYAQKYETDIGDGASTSIVVTHSLGTRAVQVTVHDNTTPFSEVYPEVRHTSTTTVTLVFAIAPTAAQYHVVIMG